MKTKLDPLQFFQFNRDRIIDDIDRKIVDALGNPLRDSCHGMGMGTFSNVPEPRLDLATVAAAARELEAINQASKPKLFTFGEVSVAGFWVRIRKVEFVESRAEYGMGEIVVTSLVPDRDTGMPIEITFRHVISVKAWESPARAEIVRQTIRHWLHHEIDEHIFAGGKRAFDPHHEDVQPPWFTDFRVPFAPARVVK